MKTLILIPCYNGRSTIECVIQRVPNEFRLDLLVIDDGSTDNLLQVLKKKKVNFIRHEKNLGYGASQKTGFVFALKTGYDVVVILHADGQYSPEKISILISPILKGKADIVSGSRMLRNSNKGQMPVLKNFGNRFLTFLENLVLGVSYSSYHCGFRAYSRRFLNSVNFALNSNGFEFDSEILFQAVSKGFKIQEISIDAVYGDEVSYLNPITYGINILQLVSKFLLHRLGVRESEQFN